MCRDIQDLRRQLEALRKEAEAKTSQEAEAQQAIIRGGEEAAATAACRFSHRCNHPFAPQDNTVADLVTDTCIYVDAD